MRGPSPVTPTSAHHHRHLGHRGERCPADRNELGELKVEDPVIPAHQHRDHRVDRPGSEIRMPGPDIEAMAEVGYAQLHRLPPGRLIPGPAPADAAPQVAHHVMHVTGGALGEAGVFNRSSPAGAGRILRQARQRGDLCIPARPSGGRRLGPARKRHGGRLRLARRGHNNDESRTATQRRSWGERAGPLQFLRLRRSGSPREEETAGRGVTAVGEQLQLPLWRPPPRCRSSAR